MRSDRLANALLFAGLDPVEIPRDLLDRITRDAQQDLDLTTWSSASATPTGSAQRRRGRRPAERLFADDPESPIPPDERTGFTGCAGSRQTQPTG